MMSRLRTPLGALALCLLLTLPAHAQAAPEAPFAAEPAFEGFGPPADASGDAPAIETDLAAVDRAYAAYLADSELQLERPEEDIDTPEPSPPPGWLQAFAEFLEALGPLFQVVFWIAAGLIVAGLLYFLFGEAIRMRFAGRKTPKEKRVDDVLQDLRPDAEAARSLLEEADASRPVR